jgi:hypothetical protein
MPCSLETTLSLCNSCDGALIFRRSLLNANRILLIALTQRRRCLYYLISIRSNSGRLHLLTNTNTASHDNHIQQVIHVLLPVELSKVVARLGEQEVHDLEAQDFARTVRAAVLLEESQGNGHEVVLVCDLAYIALVAMRGKEDGLGLLYGKGCMLRVDDDN